MKPQHVEQVPRVALSPGEAAAALGLSRRTIDTLMADPDSGFPYFKCGARVVIPMRELSAWASGQVAGRMTNAAARASAEDGEDAQDESDA